MPARLKLPIINRETGELIELDAVVYLYGEGKKDKGFIKVFHAFTEQVLMDRDVMKGAFRLFIFILSKKLKKEELDFHMKAEEVIRELGITQRTYYRWLRTLIKKGYIVRLGQNYYCLKPFTAVIGRMVNVELPFEKEVET
jgi:CRP-like cAMP-binding protein